MADPHFHPADGWVPPNGTVPRLQYEILRHVPAGVEVDFVWTRTPDLLPGTLRVHVEEPSPVPAPGTMAFHLWALRGALAPLRVEAATFFAGGLAGVLLGILAGFLTWGGGQ